jgi:protein ImuB
MSYVCVEIPDRALQAVLRSESHLREQPVVVVDGIAPPRVIAANQKARSMGVRLQFTTTEVAETDAAIEIRRRMPAQEVSVHAALLDAGWSISPRIEDRAPGLIILDLAGLNSIWPSDEHIALRLAESLSQAGLEARIAVAPNPDAAALAAQGYDGITYVARGEEAEKIGNLSVSVLQPPSEIALIFSCWGIRTCRQLAHLPSEELSERLGQAGVALQKLAQGRAVREFVPAPPPLEFTEAMELEDPIADLESFAFVLGRLLHQICMRFEMYGLAAQEFELQLELDPGYVPENGSGTTYREHLSLAVPSGDVQHLLKLWRLRLQACPPSAPIIEVQLSGVPAKPRVAQGDLFAPLSPDPEKLEILLARLRNLVGENDVGHPEVIDSHRPDAFRISGFSPARAASVGARPKSRLHPAQPNRRLVLRRFRPPVPAQVEVRNGCPTHLRFRGAKAAVVCASGPWRSSGDWWTDDSYKLEEWDVETCSASRALYPHSPMQAGQKGQQKALYRLRHDRRSGGWFLAGVYD